MGVFAAQEGINRLEMTGPEPGSLSEEADVALVSGEYFDVLGVHAVVGRTLTPDDDRSTGDSAVVSYDFWERRFAQDPAVVGKSLVVKNRSVTIVGVAPQGFFGEAVGRAPDLWVPLAMQPRFDRGLSLLKDPTTGWLRVMGRLKPHVDHKQADTALGVLLARLKSESSPVGKSTQFVATVRTSNGRSGLLSFRERFSQPLSILAGIVGLVLLIACANVSNLLLARATARQREVAVRLAIGAGRRRLVRQFLTESVLLAAIGAFLGVLFAWWGSQLLLVVASTDTPAIPIDVEPNARILGFTTAVSLFAVMTFGLVPALTASKVSFGSLLKVDAGGRRQPRVSRILVISQVALSVVLLTGAALFVQTLRNLRGRDLGFAPQSLVQSRIQPGVSGYKPEQVPELSRRVLERLKAVPGVQAASAAHSGFATGTSRTCCIAVEGREYAAGDDREVRTLGIAPDYFRTMRLPLLLGRDFVGQDSSDDRRRMPGVAIVNEAFVRQYLGEGHSIGKRLGWGDPPAVRYDIEIVGIAKDALYDEPRQPGRPLIYFPSPRGTLFVLRTAGSPESVIATIRREIQAVDPNLEFSTGAVSEDIERTLIREELLSNLSGFFGVLAATLAAIGLYGLMAYAVVKRTREIGIRMALGAARASVLRAEMLSALKLGAMGIGVGISAALVSGRLIENQLFGISATDPATLVLVAFLLALVIGGAAYLPARRASRVDPMVALRYE